MFEPKNKRDMFLLADRLNRHILILENLCKKVWLCLILSLCMSLGSSSFAVVLICCYGKFDIILYLLVLCFCLILNVLLLVRLRQLKSDARVEYRYCKKLSYLIADMVDWKVYRKRQLYKPLYFRIQNPLNKYFMFCDSYLCLFEKGRAKYYIFVCLNYFSLLFVVLYCILYAVKYFDSSFMNYGFYF